MSLLNEVNLSLITCLCLGIQYKTAPLSSNKIKRKCIPKFSSSHSNYERKILWRLEKWLFSIWFELWYWRRLLKDSWKSLGLQGDPTSPSWRKSVLNIHWKDWCWSSSIWPPDAKNWLIWKDPDAEKDWRQMEKGLTEDEMVGWHHRLNGHEFE